MRAQQKQRIMDFLTGYIASNGEAPTIKEIGQYFGWSSTASVHQNLMILQGLGLIRRPRYKMRGIEIVK
jgi:SOS-response transcriptional repressor LexA